MRTLCAALAALCLIAAAPLRLAMLPADVDVALVLAVDASSSMDEGARKLQRDGYAAALSSDRVLQAIEHGTRHRIAITYVEWGSVDAQHVVVPWTIVDGRPSGEALSRRLGAAPWQDLQRTSISAALDFAGDLLAHIGLTADRQVIDVSGDGPNNEGRVVSETRDALVARGITINGLPIVTKSPDDWLSMPDLDQYYEHCVIGGEGSFMIPVRGMANFGPALEMKLVLEIAGLPAGARIVPAAATASGRDWSRPNACHLSE